MSIGAELGQYSLQIQFKKWRFNGGGGVWTPPLGTPIGLPKATASGVNVWSTRQLVNSSRVTSWLFSSRWRVRVRDGEELIVFWISVKSWQVLATTCCWMKNKLIVHNYRSIVDKEGMKFFIKFLKQNAGCISGVLGGHDGHTPKSCCALRCTLLSLSRGNLKNRMPRSFTFVCQLYCCSSKHNNNKALRITFNCGKTVSTYNMALATVNIDKIIKVTSASSYVGYTIPWTIKVTIKILK